MFLSLSLRSWLRLVCCFGLGMATGGGLAFLTGPGEGRERRPADPPASLAGGSAVPSMPVRPGSGRAGERSAAGPELSGLPPAAVRQALNTCTDSAERRAAVRRCLERMPVEEWGDWIRKVLATETPHIGKADFAGQARRAGLISDLFAGVALLDPAGFMAVQHSRGQLNSDAEGETRLLVLMQWAELDPRATRAFLSGQLAPGTPAPGLEDYLDHIAGVLVRAGDPGVLEWALTLDAKSAGKAVAVALEGIAETDPRQAAERLAALEKRPGRDLDTDVAARIARAWAATSRQEALGWAASLSGNLRKKALEGVLPGWAAHDYEGALTAVKALPPDSVASGLAAMIGSVAVERCGELAALVEQQPAGPARAEATARVMDRWTHQNPEEASAWMKRQPEGEIRDEAIRSFVKWADVRDPEAALLWAGSMSAGNRRQEAIGHIISQLGEKAPAAVLPWLESQPAMTESERGRILQQLGKGR